MVYLCSPIFGKCEPKPVPYTLYHDNTDAVYYKMPHILNTAL